MKQLKKLTIIILCFSLLLGGCGSSEKNSYSLSEYLSTGETIWYETNGTGKDAEIECVYVIEPDGTLYFTRSNWTLGDITEKDNEKIAQLVKEKYMERYITIELLGLADVSTITNYMQDFIIHNMIVQLGGEELELQSDEYYHYRDVVNLEYNDAYMKKHPFCASFANKALAESIDTCSNEFNNILNFAKQVREKEANRYFPLTWLYGGNPTGLGKELIASYKDRIEPIAEKYAKQYLEEYQNKVIALREQMDYSIGNSFKLNVYTDSTGNNVKGESIFYKSPFPIRGIFPYEKYDCGDIESISLYKITPYESDSGETNCYQVYDAWFGGYRIDKNSYFLTQTDTAIIFELDTLDTEGVYIDKKAFELFDVNQPISIIE